MNPEPQPHSTACECERCLHPPYNRFELSIKKLDTGYTHISAPGLCNWWQGPYWPPRSTMELLGGFFPEAGATFRKNVAMAAEDAWEAEAIKQDRLDDKCERTLT